MEQPTAGPQPDASRLRRALEDQTLLLTGPDVSDVVAVRVRRVLGSAGDLLDVSESERVREVVGRTVAWVAESVGAFQRLPGPFAGGHAVVGDHAPLLQIVDRLDLLGLTLDHAYDAAHRGDEAALGRQLEVLVERFPARSEVASLALPVQITPQDLDQQVVHDHGLQVGEDGIPRLPVPEQPDPHHESREDR